MKKPAKIILGVGGVAVAAALLINPKLDNPAVAAGQDVFATNAPPAEIAEMLHAACYDCHSDVTKWPWYSHVAPVSWWLVDHVTEGRRHLNFSEWPHDDAARAAKKWTHVNDQVSSGDMPLRSYTWGHSEARLTAAQRDKLAKWAQNEADRLRGQKTDAGQ